MVKVKENRVNLNTYQDKHFKFSVDYPSNWTTKIQEWRQGTLETEASPDGGINIYISGKEDQQLYVFGQTGTVSLPYGNGVKEEKIITDSGLEGLLYTKENEGNIEIHFSIENIWIKAGRIINIEIYKQNEEKIMDVFRSIKVFENKQ